jgi:hypothetical protein
MRRIAQVRVADWIARTLTIVTFFAFFFAPSQWVLPLVLVCFAVVGACGLVYPEVVLGWAKTARPEIDVDDRSAWWVPRLIGAAFLLIVLVTALATVYRG